MNSLVRWQCLSVAFVLVVFVAGCEKTPHITLACEATPPAVYPGELVIVNAPADSVSTGKSVNLLYDWSGAGVVANGETARVVTGSMVPGTYTVNAVVKEGKPGKEGQRPGESAKCSTAFTVKKFDPPIISCSADPPTVSPGVSSRITCVGASPQDRPLSYRYSTTGGGIIGIGSVGIFFASEAPIGPVTITATVEDDENHKTSTETTVTIAAAPPPPAIPHVQPLCRISLAQDNRDPTWVTNEAAACLDKVALSLHADSGANAVVVADSTTSEKEMTFKEEHSLAKHKHANIQYLAEKRAVSLKDYLVREKGIDPARIAIATGMENDRNGQAYLVPEGASFDAEGQGTTWINESVFASERP